VIYLWLLACPPLVLPVVFLSLLEVAESTGLSLFQLGTPFVLDLLAVRLPFKLGRALLTVVVLLVSAAERAEQRAAPSLLHHMTRPAKEHLAMCPSALVMLILKGLVTWNCVPEIRQLVLQAKSLLPLAQAVQLA
jgi:hypothetical protein